MIPLLVDEHFIGNNVKKTKKKQPNNIHLKGNYLQINK